MLLMSLLHLLLFKTTTAWPLDLINIPYGEEEKLTYSISPKNSCDFEGIEKIEAPRFFIKHEGSFVVNTLNYFQQKLNLNIDKEEITKERIFFSLTGATNIYFEFFYKKEKNKCKLVRVIHIDDMSYNLDQIDIEISYKSSLKAYVLEKIIIRDKEHAEKDLALYPWSLRGQMSVYEFNIGPAINIHSNIRVKDRNKYNKNNPVIEPIPAFFFRYGPFFLNKNGLGSLVFNKGDLSVIAMGLLEGEPYRPPNINEREKGVFLGSILKYNFLEFTFYRDFFENKGQNLKLNLAPEYLFRMNWKFSPQLFFQFWDNKYMNYYFGVTNDEASRALIPAYQPKNTFNSGFMFELTHYAGKWTFLVSTGAKLYGKEVYKSPTVNKEVEGRFIFSILYKVF